MVFEVLIVFCVEVFFFWIEMDNCLDVVNIKCDSFNLKYVENFFIIVSCLFVCLEYLLLVLVLFKMFCRIL